MSRLAHMKREQFDDFSQNEGWNQEQRDRIEAESWNRDPVVRKTKRRKK
jgi:hypothetical protein